MDDLELELKMGFLEEADQLIQDAEQCFLEIESSPNDTKITDQLFRLAHNLKGSAKAVGFAELGDFTHLIESLLLKIKNGETSVQSTIVDLLLACKDQLQIMIEGLKKDLNATFDCSALNARLTDAISGQSQVTEESSSEELDVPPADAGGFVEIEEIAESQNETELNAVELDNSLVSNQEIEESVLDSSLPDVISKEPTIAATIPSDKPKNQQPTDETIRVSLERVDQLINFVGEMAILQSVLFEQAYSDNIVSLRKTVHQLGKISKELQDVSMSLRMIPLKQTFQKMQRIVRDTSKSLNKKVNLILQGEDTEVEKTVLELISDPLVHLIRNAVDHGIDSSEDRQTAGKNEMGSITLRAYHQADSIVLEVEDDGKGIDADRLRTKAIEKKIIRPEQAITDKQAINLIFHPGFSTKQNVSDISGRGVGLDVVKTNIEKLQGSVEVSTEVGKGSKFRIQLPLTLAIIDATTVKINDQRYAIPMTHIHESVRITDNDLLSSVNVGEVINLRGENLRVYRLNQLLGIKENEKESANILLVSRLNDRPFGILVSDISSVQQIVVKKLSIEISNLVGISGSAILGDGKPALILDIPRLIEVPISKNFKPNKIPVRASA